MAKYRQIPTQVTKIQDSILEQIAFDEAIKTHSRPSKALIMRKALNEYIEKHYPEYLEF